PSAKPRTPPPAARGWMFWRPARPSPFMGFMLLMRLRPLRAKLSSGLFGKSARTSRPAGWPPSAKPRTAPPEPLPAEACGTDACGTVGMDTVGIATLRAGMDDHPGSVGAATDAMGIFGMVACKGADTDATGTLGMEACAALPPLAKPRTAPPDPFPAASNPAPPSPAAPASPAPAAPDAPDAPDASTVAVASAPVPSRLVSLLKFVLACLLIFMSCCRPICWPCACGCCGL